MPAQSQELGEPWCTLTWDGGGETNLWHEPANWDLDRVPATDFTDRVCIPASAGPVVHSTGWSPIDGLMSDAPLIVEGGRLEVPARQSIDLATLDFRGGEIVGWQLNVDGDVTWSGGRFGYEDEPMWVHVGDPLAATSSSDLYITGDWHDFRGPIAVRGSVDIAEGATVAATHGSIEAGETVTVSGTLIAEVVGGLSGDDGVVVEPGGGVYGVFPGGTWTNRGTFEGELRPGAGDFEITSFVNEGTATVWGSTGAAPLQNALGATLTTQGTFYTFDVANDGVIRVGRASPYGPSELHLLGTYSGEGAIDIVEGAITVGDEEADQFRAHVTDANIQGSGPVTAVGNSTLSGSWLVGPDVAMVLDGDGVELAGATVTADNLSIINASVAPGAESTLNVGTVHIGDRDPEALRVADGAQLTTTQTMTMYPGSRVNGAGTLVNDGTILTQEPNRWGEPFASLGLRLENNGTINVPETWLRVSTLVNAGLVEFGADAQLPVEGAFDQTADGVLSVVADGSDYDFTQTDPKGDVSGITAASADVGGAIAVTGINGCITRAPVIAAPTATGSPALTSDVPECEYGLGVDAAGLNLIANDVTPPSLPAYDYGLAWGDWAGGTRITGGVVPKFRLIPSLDDDWAAPTSDDITGLRQVVQWWDTNPDATRAAMASRLDHSATNGDRYLAVEGTTANLWHHVAAQDWAGNWTEVRHDGPFQIDMTPPTAPVINADHVTDLHHVSGSTFEVRWSPATDTHAGMASPAYSANHDLDTDTEYPQAADRTNARVYRFQPEPGHDACVGVTAHDRAGNTRRSVRCIATAYDDDQFNASDDWRVRRDPDYYYGDYSVTRERGATLTKRVSARRLWLVASTCPDCGTVDVFWNGEWRDRVSLDSKVDRKKVLLPIKRFDARQKGALKIRVASSGRPVKIQGVIPEG